MQDERFLTPRMTSSESPSTPRRAQPSSPYSTDSSPNSRRPLWEGLDPARLAAREASIRARMESRRVGSPSGVPGEVTGRSVSSPLPRDTFSRRSDLPRTPVMLSRRLDQHLEISPSSTNYARPYSPFDVGLDRVRNTFNSSPGHKSMEAAFIRHSQASSAASTPVREDRNMADLTPWTSYFDDPYRSPSAASSFREECAAPPRNQHLPPSPLQLPRLPWAGEPRRPSMERRGSAPLSSPKASTLKDLEDISRSLDKKSKRLSSASLLVDARSQVWESRIPSPLDRNYQSESTTTADRIERNRKGTLASLSSGTPPASQRARQRDSIKSLHRMSSSAPTTPIGEAPQLPLPLLPGKKERRRVRVRASETNEGTWELDDLVDGFDGLKGLGAGSGLGFSPVIEGSEYQAGGDEDLTITLNTPNMSGLIEPSIFHETQGRISPNRPSEIVDPTAPTASIELCIPTDRSLGDLAGMLDMGEDRVLTSSSQNREQKRRSAKIVLDFPLPPARAFTTTVDETERQNNGIPAGRVRKLDAAFELHPKFYGSNVQGNATANDDLWAESELAAPATLKSCRSSASSQTTAASSCTQLTPRNSLERIIQSPHVRQDSYDFSLATMDLANLECLISGDLEAMLSAAEIDNGLTDRPDVRDRKPQPGTPVISVHGRRVLPPPGPDAAYWGEPEIILFDQDNSSPINSIHNSLFEHGIIGPTSSTRPVDVSTSRKSFPKSVPLLGSSVVPHGTQKIGRTSSPFTPKAKEQAGLRLLTPRRVIPSRSLTGQTPRSISTSSQMLSSRTDGLVDRMAAFLPVGLGLTRLRSSAAVRAGSSVLRNVGRVGTAVSAYNYAKPMLGRLTERSSKNYDGHIPLNWFENAFLAGGSGVIGVADTSRGDLVALLSETSSQSFMPRLHAAMKSQPEGRQILKDRPLISSKTIDLDYLRTLKRGTLGREWVEWLIEGGVTPDTRHEVVHIDSPVLAYTMTRYRQTHDLYHTLFSLPPTLAYELSLKVLELSNMSLPVAGLSSAFGPFRLSSSRRHMWREDWMGWALRQGARSRPLVGIYWEKRWEQGLGDLRQELGVKRMDDRAVINRWKSYRLIREKESALRAKGEWVDEPEDW